MFHFLCFSFRASSHEYSNINHLILVTLMAISMSSSLRSVMYMLSPMSFLPGDLFLYLPPQIPWSTLSTITSNPSLDGSNAMSLLVFSTESQQYQAHRLLEVLAPRCPRRDWLSNVGVDRLRGGGGQCCTRSLQRAGE